MHLCHQGEAEFTALGQRQATAPGRFAIAAAQLDQGCDDCALDQHQGQGQAQNQQAVVNEQLQIDQHADTDEKQPQQDVAKWPDVGFYLVPVVAFAQQHACQEGAQCWRQTEQVG